MDPKQLFPAHFQSVFGKNKVLFPRELKKNIPKGLKKVLFPKNVPKMGQNLARYPQKWKNRSRTPKIPPFHCVSAANAWASAHALSMVMWYHQNIVNSYHLIKLTHLFKPLLVRVLMVKFPIVSLSFATLSWSFACHLHFRKLNPKGMPKNSKKEKMCTKLA